MDEAIVVLGIDFGSTNSVIATIEDNDPVVIRNDIGDFTTPTCAVRPEGTDRLLEFGKSAVHRALHSPETAYDGFKYQLGTCSDENSATKMQMAAMFLAELKKQADTRHQGKIIHAVLTVPAFFNSAQRHALCDAALLASFDNVRILNETTAVAAQYAVKLRLKVPKWALIVDIGGGGGCVTVVKAYHRNVNVLASSENRLPGGNDFDKQMEAYLLRRIRTIEGPLTDEEWLSAPCRRQWLQIKEKLSRLPEVPFTLFLPVLQKEVSFVLTRSDFEKECHDLFQIVLKDVRNVLSKAKLDTRKVDHVILVGGSTRIPYLRTLIRQHFDNPPLVKAINPDEAIATGAALVGDGQCNVVDMTSINHLIQYNGKKITFPAGTKLPYKKVSLGSLKSIKVCQGEENTVILDSTKELKSARGFQVNASGLFSLLDAKGKEIHIPLNNCLAPTSFHELQAKISTYKANEVKDLQRLEVKNTLEQKCRDYSRIGTGQEEPGSSSYLLKQKSIFNLKWLEKNPDANKEDYEERLFELDKLVDCKNPDAFANVSKDSICDGVSSEIEHVLAAGDSENNKKPTSFLNTAPEHNKNAQTGHHESANDENKLANVVNRNSLCGEVASKVENVLAAGDSENNKPTSCLNTDPEHNKNAQTGHHGSANDENKLPNVVNRNSLCGEVASKVEKVLAAGHSENNAIPASFLNIAPEPYNNALAFYGNHPISHPLHYFPPTENPWHNPSRYHFQPEPRYPLPQAPNLPFVPYPMNYYTGSYGTYQMPHPYLHQSAALHFYNNVHPFNMHNTAQVPNTTPFPTLANLMTQVQQPAANLPTPVNNMGKDIGAPAHLSKHINTQEVAQTHFPTPVNTTGTDKTLLEEPVQKSSRFIDTVIENVKDLNGSFTSETKSIIVDEDSASLANECDQIDAASLCDSSDFNNNVLNALKGNVVGEEISLGKLKKEIYTAEIGEVDFNDKDKEENASEDSDTDVRDKTSAYRPKDIFNYLLGKGYPDGLSKNDKRNLRLLAKKSFKVEDDKLMHKSHAGKKSHHGREKTFPSWVKVIFSRKKQMEIIKLAHEGSECSVEATSVSAHRGENSTIDIISRRGWWPKLTNDVKKFIKSCEACQLVNLAVLKAKDPLKPVPPPSSILKQIGIDIIQMPEVDGYKFAVIAVDYLSKYCHGKALISKEAKQVALFLFEWICLFGCPEIIINDQGREFVNEVNIELQMLTGTKQRVTRPYNPQANGQCERQNKIVKMGLLKTLALKDNIGRWPDALNGVMMAHRCQKQRSTNFSPFYMLFGREPNLPIDLLIENDDDDDILGSETEEEHDVDSDSAGENNSEPTLEGELQKLSQIATEENEYLEKMKAFVSQYEDLKKQVLSKAKENIKKSQQKMKTEYDKRHGGGTIFQIGDVVKKRNLRRDERKGDWQQLPFTGPYVITSIKDGAYVLKNKKTGYMIKGATTARNLRPFVEREEDNKQYDSANSESDNGQSEGVVEPSHNKEIKQKTANSSVATEPDSKPPVVILDDDSKSVGFSKPVLQEPQEITQKRLDELLVLPNDTVILRTDLYKLTAEDIQRLQNKSWLIDTIVNAYFKLIENREQKGKKVLCFDSFFMVKLKIDFLGARKWVKNVNVFDFQTLLVPIHGESNFHWTLCAIDLESKKMSYYDSLNGKTENHSAAHMDALEKFLQAEYATRIGGVWQEFSKSEADIENQENSYDCGVFICFFARRIAQGRTCRVPARGVSRMRWQMSHELISKKLMGEDFLQEEYSQESIHNAPLDLYTPPAGIVVIKTGAGIKNLGNTCFLNSCLQVLFHCPPFCLWLLNDTAHRAECKNRDCITCEIGKALSESRLNTSLEPQRLVNSLQLFWKQYVPGTQQDAQEFLSLLLLRLRREFLTRHKIHNLDMRSQETTPVDNIFGFYLRKDTVCGKCGHVSKSFNHGLQYNINVVKCSSVFEGLKFGSSVCPVSDYKCRNCLAVGNATHCTKFETLPRVLIVCLLRFTEDNIKIESKVSAEDVLNLKELLHTESQYKISCEYKVGGSITHHGSTAAGHYTASAMTSGGRWTFDDTSITRTTQKRGIGDCFYIIFYERK